MTRTAIIVDSSCSLPRDIREKYNVAYAPLTITVDGESFVDPCQQNQAVELFQSGRFSKKHKVETTPPSPEAFEKVIDQKIQEGFDRVFVQTLNRTQGETYNNANTAVARVSKRLPDKSTVVRVMDSRTVFAGQGLMATETIRRMLREKSHDEVRRKMDVISEKIHTFIIPKEIFIARERSTARNENNVSWGQALIASALSLHPIICNVNDSSHVPVTIRNYKKAAKKLFDHARQRMDAGLYSPFVTVTYAGPLEELKALPGYSELEQKVKEKNLKLIPSVASLSCGIYTSPGSISLALATDAHSWE